MGPNNAHHFSMLFLVPGEDSSLYQSPSLHRGEDISLPSKLSFVFYLQIAIYGYNFCVATCKVVNLLLRNIVRTIVKDNIVRFLLFLGELCIVLVVGEYSNCLN